MSLLRYMSMPFLVVHLGECVLQHSVLHEDAEVLVDCFRLAWQSDHHGAVRLGLDYSNRTA